MLTDWKKPNLALVVENDRYNFVDAMYTERVGITNVKREEWLLLQFQLRAYLSRLARTYGCSVS